MNHFLISTLLVILAVSVSGCAKFRQDYFTHSTARYRPSDPWCRSWVRIWQTGHGGLFYNCDGEERKRCSPYICWKHADPPWPCETIPKSIRRDLHAIRQRIRDGSCYSDGSQCTDSGIHATERLADAPELVSDRPTAVPKFVASQPIRTEVPTSADSVAR